MKRYKAVLIAQDGRRIRVTVPYPPPSAFLLARHGSPNIVFVREGTGLIPVTYVEHERRKFMRFRIRRADDVKLLIHP